MTKEELDKEIRENKIQIIKLLAEQLVSLNCKQFEGFPIEENKPIPYYDATIDILKKHIKNAKATEAKLLKFDKIAENTQNLSKKDLKKLIKQQKATNKRVESFLATLDPLASLRGNIAAPGAIILRYRGKGIDDPFLEKYPFRRLL